MLRFEVAQHYEEQLPAETEGMKECDALANETLARIEFMKLKAIRNGQFINLRWRGTDYDFNEMDLPKHPEASKINMRDLIAESQIRREMNGRSI